MKQMIFTALVLAASAVHASEVRNVLEADLPAVRGQRVSSDASFYIDTESKTGFVNVTVTEEIAPRYHPTPFPPCGPYGGCYPGPGGYNPAPVWRTIFSSRVQIEGLELVDTKVMYQSNAGAVECGTFGTSRILRRPTIYLTGKCSLDSKVVKTATGHKVLVTFKTK